MQTLVVGAGYTGSRLLQRFDNAVGLSRTATADATPPVWPFDADHGSELPFAIAGPCHVVYTVPPAASDASTDSDSRLAHLLQCLGPVVDKIVYLSSTGVYGHCPDQTVNEDRAPAPQTARAKRRAIAEQTLTEWSAQNSADAVILRAPGIYGPGRLGIDRLRDRQPLICENEANPGNRIHVDDLVGCCLAALHANVPAGIYNIGDGDTRSSTWFAGEVARQLGLEPPPEISRTEARSAMTPQRLSFLNESRQLDLSRMHDTLQVSMQYPDAAEGIAASLPDSR